jgi:hypothetical protein
MDMPVQGDFEYTPLVILFEDSTMDGLQVQMNVSAQIQGQDIDDFFIIEEIEYQVVVTKQIDGMNPPELIYSAMVHVSHAHRI